MAVQIGTTLTANLNVIPTRSDESFSSRLVNYVEGVLVGGDAKTKIYTEVNTNLKVGDRVFIVNGNYCTAKLNREYIYNDYATGYKILEIDRCAITIDYDFNNMSIKEVADFNDEDKFIKAYVVNETRDVDYNDYLMSNEKTESNASPKFEFITGAPPTIKDVIYNNTGSIISTSFGNVNPDEFYSYILFGGEWIKVPVSDSILTTALEEKELYIMEPFELVRTSQNLNCEKGKVYYYDSTDALIKLDITYEDAFISKSNFRFGNFKSGNWNDGIFGKKTDDVNEKKTYWEGAKWKNGIFYNSDWLTGRMESKSDAIKQQSYYGELDDDGLIKQSTDFTNNKSFGYNYVFESNIEKARIDNANIFRASFGTASISDVRDEYYTGGTNSSDITISKGLYYDCDFNYTNIFGGVFELSDIENSNIKGARILDSNIDVAVVQETEYDSIGSIKIIDYDKQYFRLDDYGVKRIGIKHKFYLSDEDFLKIEQGDSVYFNYIVSDHLGVDSLFDKEYFIGVGPEANTNGFDHGYLNNEHEVIVDLRPKSKNKYKYVIDSGTTSFNVVTASNDKFYNSLDLTFIVAPVEPTISTTYSLPVGSNDYDNIYNNIILANEDYKSKIISYSEARIQVSKMNNTYFNNSTWKRGSKEIPQDFVIKPDDAFPFDPNYPIMSITGSFGNYELSVNLDYSDSRDLWRDENLDIDQLVYINNITYDEGTASYDLSGVYQVSTYSYGTNSRTVQLSDYFTPTLNIGTTFSLNGTYSYRNVPFKTGALTDVIIDNSLITSASFRRMNFNNTEFYNSELDTTDELMLKENIKKLKVFRSFLSEEDNLKIRNSFITESALKGTTVSNALVFNSIGYENTFNDGLYYGSYWDSGVFNGGKFHGQASGGSGVLNLKELEKATEWYSPYAIFSGFAVWKSGTFNNGEFFSSYWVDGTFNNGKFSRALWDDGTWNNGLFGDTALVNEDTQFWSGDWNGGIFQKGIFGYRTTTTPLLAPYSYWYGGEFRDGVFTGATSSIDSTPIGNTIWYDGTFNGGEISGSARWKDGIFNGGKFRTFWGGGTGSSASNYGWENGLFNSGEFGDITYKSSTTWNSTWYDGIFEGGIFQGKVWNKGVFTGGKFLGMTANGASASGFILNEPMNAVQKPEHFVLSYSTEMSDKDWYGLWRDGIVIDNLEDLTNKSDRRFKAIRAFKGQRRPTIIFENTLWVNGTFSSTSAQMRNSVWLDGNFGRGEFIESNFNPYVPRWDFELDGGGSSSTTNEGVYQHSLTDSCVWNGGVLDNSSFHMSSWNNGRFLFGTMSNAEFNSGVANYMNAYNVIWNDGRWRNGNWYGANNNVIDFFNEEPLATGGSNPGRVWAGKNSGQMDGIVHQMRRHNETSIFFWSLCNISFEYNDIDAYGFINPIATNNNYHDVNGFVGGLLTDPLVTGLATNVDFGGYDSFGYDAQAVGLIAEPVGPPTPPFGLTMGVVVDNSLVLAKFGNGAFKSGVWENGVWNNGPRDVFWENTEELKFFDAVNFYQLSKDVWQIVLTGSDQNSDISSFSVGDEVAIGNIALTDINGDRKLITDKFRIVNIDEDLNYLYVNAVINFPIRRIDIDSHRHKIAVTKNIWLSGLFLNGKFNGVWNNGYFKGYPCITEMYDSHWIEGTLDGGHFLAQSATYSDSLTGTMSSTTYSTGIIQNAKIYTNIENPSETQPDDDNRFDTYLDVIYSDGTNDLLQGEELRTTSLNFDLVGNGGADNPYLSGAPITYDVMSSVTNTIFRPNVYYNFNFGIKFKEYDNILTDDVSEFNDIQDPERLEDRGWSFTTDSGGFLKLPGGPALSPSQTVFLASDNDFTEPQTNGDTGYPLNAMNFEPQGADKYYVYHENQTNINKLRYTRIDVDYTPPTFDASDSDGYFIPFPSYGSLAGQFYTDLAYTKGSTFKMSSFFFNRPIDDPLYVSGGDVGFGMRLDNAKYIELDMIPMLDYANVTVDTDNINCDVRIPLQATAPFIDYDDTDFSFIDNVSFEFNAESVAPAPTSPPIFVPSESQSVNR
jgi:hypothetical protein